MSTLVRWNQNARGHGERVRWINLGTHFVNRHTHVFASITEISQPPGGMMDFPFLGAAKMTVNNIVPFDDGTVKLLVTIDWDEDLNYRLNFATSDD